MAQHVGPSVDLVIPALNEEANVTPLLAALPGSVLRHVVLADNGSTDRTAELAAAGGAQVVHEPRRGYGAACLAGLKWIDSHPPLPDMVAFLDADLSDDPAQLPCLIDPIAAGRADLVLGSRPARAEAGALTLTQRVGNLVSCTMLRFLTGVRFTDLGPLRVVRWSSLSELRMSDQTWGWTVEMQFKAAALGLRCLEVQVPYRRRHLGRSKISGSIPGATAAGLRIALTIGQLWWWHRRGRL